jgi:methionine synthase I (cobalamin-dependent)
LHSNYFTYLCKTIYISGNFIAIEKYNIVEWDDVKDAVAEQINTFVDNGGTIITIEENKTKKQP